MLTTLDTIITKKARQAPSDCDDDLQVPIPNDNNQSDFIACTSHPVEANPRVESFSIISIYLSTNLCKLQQAEGYCI